MLEENIGAWSYSIDFFIGFDQRVSVTVDHRLEPESVLGKGM